METTWRLLSFVEPDMPICQYDNAHCYVPDCPSGGECIDPETGLPASEGICQDSTTSGPPCATNGDGAFCGGHCVDRNTDPLNCGTCFHECGSGTPNCVGGTCVP